MCFYVDQNTLSLPSDAQIMACQFIDNVGDDNETNDQNNDTTIEFSLNRTVLHAQGGGQPTDIGIVEIHEDSNNEEEEQSPPKKTIEVTKVLLDRSTGVANHMGRIVVSEDEQEGNNRITNTTSPATIDVKGLVGRSVRVKVDMDQRQILSECHTAGHVVDSAIARCGRTLPPVKGYHFLDGPYVEYKGSIPPEERDELLKHLQQAFVELVEEDIPTKIDNLSRADAQSLCDRVAANYFDLQQQFPDDEKDVRIVTVAGWPCPCGGTHVRSTGALKDRQWGITGFRSKKSVVRVKYNMNWKDAK
jgi:Ser-tRNA(Ala) deacylase AlaX